MAANSCFLGSIQGSDKHFHHFQPGISWLFPPSSGFSLAQLLFPTRPVCRDGVGTDLLSPIVESRAQRFSSTAVYPSCRRTSRLEKTSLVCGGTTDTLLQVGRRHAHEKTFISGLVPLCEIGRASC